MTGRTVAFWGATLVFCLVMGGGGVADILLVEPAREILTHLGYPSYMGPMIGVAKLLGAIALLIPGFPILKEWAYAGCCIDLLGAIVSHLASGDGLGTGGGFPAVAVLALGAVSYLTRPPSRRPAPSLDEPPLPASVALARD